MKSEASIKISETCASIRVNQFVYFPDMIRESGPLYVQVVNIKATQRKKFFKQPRHLYTVFNFNQLFLMFLLLPLPMHLSTG